MSCCDDHELVDWPERTITIQRNWIGRSEGAELLFRIDELDVDMPVFTTRPGHGVRRDLLRAGARASAGRRAGRAPSTRTRCASTCDGIGAGAARSARGAEEKTGVFTGRLRHEPGERRADPGLGRRLRADGVRDRRDHGRPGARRARPRVRASASSLPIRPRGECDERAEDVLVDSGEFPGCPPRRRSDAIVEWLGRRGRGGRRSASACATGASRASATGAARSRSSTVRTAASSPFPRTSCRCCCRRSRTTGRRAAAAGLQRGVDQRAVPEVRRGRRGARPTRWTRSSTRPGTSCVTAIPQNDEAPFDRATGRLLVPGRPVHRRDRPRDRAPALLALLHQGAEGDGAGRLPRAVPAAVPPGVGATGRLEDVEVERERDGPESSGRRVRGRRSAARTSSSWARPTRTWSGPRRDRGHRAVPAAAVAGRRTRSPSEPAGGDVRDAPLARKAHKTIAKVTDDIGRRFQFNTPIAAVMELSTSSCASPTDPAARFAAETAVSLIQPYAPHIAEELWGALGHERLWEQPWPVADRALLERETFELVDPGERQGAGPDGGLGRAVRGRSWSSAPRLAAGAGAPGRQGDPADDRRARKARQHRRLAGARVRAG